MYEELDGAFKDGVVDTTLNGKLPNGNLPELMAAQNHFVSFFDNHTYFYAIAIPTSSLAPAAPTT